MSDTRSSSAMFKRAEQLKRWEDSDTNKQSAAPKRPARIQFSTGIVFLAACAAGDKDEVQRLLKMGADINTSNVDGLTALHQACIDDNLDMVEFLVTHGADVNRGDNEGWTPLHATASCGFLSIARYLLENGADVAAVNCDGELAVDIAESDAMEEMLQKVIDEKGIDCEKARNAEVDTLLSDAKKWASNGYTDVRDPKTGGTPLHVAAAKGYTNVLKCLLEEVALEVDSSDYEGWTPLHAAALWGQKDAAAILLTFGADPLLKNYSGQTCLDLVDPGIATWLAEAVRHVNNNNNINKKKRKINSPPRNDVKRVELQIKGQENNIEKPASSDPAPAPAADAARADDAPPWRSASFSNRQPPTNRKQKPANSPPDNDTILRRTHSFENDKTFIQRYRDVTARIKATSCPSIPPPPAPARDKDSNTNTNARDKDSNTNTNDTANTTNEDRANTANIDRVSPDSRERDGNSWSSPATNSQSTSSTVTLSPRSSTEESNNSSISSTPSSASTPTKLSPGNIFKNFFKSFVPPVRDEESETQRKAHAKRVRETRRSTQGVTLDELKSAEQLVKKKTNNGTAEGPAAAKVDDTTPATDNSQAVTAALASVASTATATIAASSERRPSWRLRLDPANKFELEDAGRSSPRPADSAPAPAAAEATVTVRRPPSGANAAVTAAVTPAVTPAAVTPAAVTNAVTTGAVTTGAVNSSSKEEAKNAEDERDRESSSESKPCSPASTQAALNVIMRRRRPKRRSTGVTHVDDIVNDNSEGGDGDVEPETTVSGNERTEEPPKEAERDYKALYEASQAEVRRLRALLTTSEQQLRDARATISRLTKVNQNSLSEVEKREKRAMERKLSEMEEELKQLQKLKAENERLRAENRALTRVVSKLTDSARK